MDFNELRQYGEEEEKFREAQEPSLLDTTKSAIATNITGASTFIGMVERKGMMPNNDGDSDFNESDEFKQILKESGKDISISDRLELDKAKNADYLRAKLGNQKRYRDNLDTLEKSGFTGLAMEMVAGSADIPSWLAGGVIFKAGNTAKKAYQFQHKASNLLYDMAHTGASVGGAVYTSEKMIQAEAGVNMDERANDMAMYGTMFGVALPLLGTTFSAVASGEGRKSLARNTATLMEKVPRSGGLRSFFSISSADQAIHKTNNPLANKYGHDAVTRVSAEKTAKGDFIVDKDDKAMDYVEMTVGSIENKVALNIDKNAKSNGVSIEQQALDDGKAWNDFTNNIEQDVRKEVGAMSDEIKYKNYIEATGQKLPEERVKIKNGDDVQEVLQVKRPDDLDDIVTAHIRGRNFDNGKYNVPTHLKYITDDLYGRIGEDATTYGLKGVAGKDSRGYGHIKYNEEEILRDVPDAERKLKEMLMADAGNKADLAKGTLKEEDITKEAENMAKGALDRDIQHKYIDGASGSGATSAVKRRRLRMDRSLYPEMFVNDISLIASEYVDKMAGKIAMKKTWDIDTDASGKLKPVIEARLLEVAAEGRKMGMSEKAIERDVDNVKAIFETVLGSRKYNKDPDALANKTSRMLRKGASALYNSNFVTYALVEPTVSIMRHGLPSLIDNFIPAHKQALDNIKNLDSKDPKINMYRQAGLAVQMLRSKKYDRYENMEITPTTGKTEMWLDKIAHWGRKYSGFNFVNDASDFVAGGGALAELNTLMKRPNDMSTAEASRMARYGLDSEDLAYINKQDIKYDKDGNVVDWNYTKWADEEVSKNFIRYLSRATRDTIVRADGTRVHRYQSDVNNPLASLAFQFTQMPTVLFERLLVNMGDEVSARTATGIITSIAMMYTILSLKDAALVQAGAKDDYDDYEDILLKATMSTPFMAIVPTVANLGLTAFGHEAIGGYRPSNDIASAFGGAGIGVANKILKVSQGIGDGVDGVDASNMMKITPILNSHPITFAGMKAIEKGLKDE